MFLNKIVATKRNEVDALAMTFSLKEAEKQIAELAACRGFENALTNKRKRNLGLIAEVKKASPSKGLIRPDFQPVEIAKAYEAAGADCISVLTDADFFQGSNRYLTDVHHAVNLPILRKDFIIDYRQIYEARLIGADAVLLIAAILKPADLQEFHDIARAIGLDVLVEVHDQEEMETVLNMQKATLVGINNRNLQTFKTDLKTTEQLIKLVPDGITVISESAISSVEDIAYVTQAGADGVLVGEHFMRYNNVGAAIHKLLGPVNEA